MFVMGTVFQFPELLLLPVQFYSKYFQLLIHYRHLAIMEWLCTGGFFRLLVNVY